MRKHRDEVDGDAHSRSAINGGERDGPDRSGGGRRNQDWRGLGHGVAHGVARCEEGER